MHDDLFQEAFIGTVLHLVFNQPLLGFPLLSLYSVLSFSLAFDVLHLLHCLPKFLTEVGLLPVIALYVIPSLYSPHQRPLLTLRLLHPRLNFSRKGILGYGQQLQPLY